MNSGVVIVIVLVVVGILFAVIKRQKKGVVTDNHSTRNSITVDTPRPLVNYDGVRYKIVTRPRDFLLSYRNSESAAIRFKINDYQKIVFAIRDEGNALSIDITKAFSPSTIVKARTLEPYSMEEIFTVFQGGSLNPNEDAYLFNSVRPSSENVSRIESVNNLKAYFRHLAELWWPNLNPYDTTSSHSETPGARICDWCSNDVLYGDGYIYGYYASGNLVAYRLWCEKCMDQRLETYREDGLTSEGGYFESEDVRRANDYAGLRKR
jgi:hypothetical protein